MTAVETARFCPECGKAANGNFCAACGTQLSGPESEDWAGIVSEVSGLDDRYGVLHVQARLWRAPVRGLMELTFDPQYKGPLSFFLTLLGAKLFVQFALVPRITAAFGGAPEGDTTAVIVRENIMQYASLLIFLPLGYYVLGKAANVARSQRNYYRYSLIGSGFIFSIELAALVAVIVIGFVLAFVCTFFLPPIVWDTLQTYGFFDRLYGALIIVSIIGYYIAATRAFWQMSWVRAVAMTTVMLGLTAPIYVLLGRAIDASGIVKLFVW